MKYAILLICVCWSTITIAQGDTLSLKKSLGSYVAYKGASKLSLNETVAILMTVDKAQRQTRKAKSMYTIGMILSAAGGYVLGGQLGRSVAGGEVSHTAMLGGAILIGINIPIIIAYNRHLEKAVRTYNSSVLQKGSATISD